VLIDHLLLVLTDLLLELLLQILLLGILLEELLLMSKFTFRQGLLPFVDGGYLQLEAVFELFQLLILHPESQILLLLRFESLIIKQR